MCPSCVCLNMQGELLELGAANSRSLGSVQFRNEDLSLLKHLGCGARFGILGGFSLGIYARDLILLAKHPKSF